MLAVAEVEAFDESYVIDWDESLMVGDRQEDEECARRAAIAFRYADDFFGRGE
jgi:histidinol phosphatase-like enzyme